jgi:hypothetical protein
MGSNGIWRIYTVISFEYADDGKISVVKMSIMDEKEEIGFFILIPQSVNVYEVHTHFYPQAYGSAVAIGKAALKDGFTSNADIEVLVTKVPVNNPLAKRMALKTGWKLYGTLPNSFKTAEGNFIDQELYYIDRGSI